MTKQAKYLTTLLAASLTLFNAAGISLYAQETYYHRLYTKEENGLSYNLIENIVRDQSGLLWLATGDGISRFDGYDFVNYFHMPDDSASFPLFNIDKVLADQTNTIWVFSQRQPAYRYNKSSNSFEKFGKNKLTDLTLANDGNIWMCVSTAKALRYNPNLNKLIEYKIECDSQFPDISPSFGPMLVTDNHDNVWLFFLEDDSYSVFQGTYAPDSRIIFHRLTGFNIARFKSKALHNIFVINDIYIDKTGQTWFFTLYGLYRLNTLKERLEPVTTIPDLSLFEGKPYFTWAEDDKGIFIIETAISSLFNIETGKGNYTEGLFIDAAGTVWCGNINDSRTSVGLNKYVKKSGYFNHYLTSKNSSNELQIVFPIAGDKKGNLLAGTRNKDGFYKISPSGEEMKIHLIGRKNSPKPCMPRCLLSDDKGIWIGTTDSQIEFYDNETGKVSLEYTHPDDDLGIIGMFRSPVSGNLVIYNSTYIYLYNPSTKKLLTANEQYPQGNCFSLIHDGKDGYWLGSYSNTVLHLDKNMKTDATYKIGADNSIVDQICLGDNNDLWIAFMGSGLGHLYPATGKYEIFTTADGLPNNVIYAILEDRTGNLWLSTNEGISRFNPATRYFRNFDKTDGLMITEFDAGSYYQSPDGRMFFGGVGGFVGFYPDKVDNSGTDSQTYPLIITDFTVSGAPVAFQKAVYEMDTLVLRKGDNNFQASFTCLDYRFPQKIKYRYRLSGADNEWVETDYRNRRINFSNLAPGNHILEIQATNEKGVWTNKRTVVISIPHRFLELLWVKLTLLLLALIAVIFIIFSYIKQLQLKSRQVQNELRMESLRGQMNPHFIFNSLNSINYFISKKDKFSANQYIADFSQLIRSILNNTLNEYIPFEKEVESINAYLKLEHLRFGDKFNYTINTERINNPESIMIYPGMIQPFIENAIWHGVRGLQNRVGTVSIEFLKEEDHKIRCIITDDGVGRKLANLSQHYDPNRKSRGIGIVMERLRIANTISDINYRLDIEDLYPGIKETGTKVIIEIPTL